MATLLQLVQQATGEMGLAVPNSVSSSTATDIVQLMYLTNAVGYELAREFHLKILLSEYTKNKILSRDPQYFNGVTTKLIKDGDVIFDIGAQSGSFSLLSKFLPTTNSGEDYAFDILSGYLTGEVNRIFKFSSDLEKYSQFTGYTRTVNRKTGEVVMAGQALAAFEVYL
jgi:hypothetical protein